MTAPLVEGTRRGNIIIHSPGGFERFFREVSVAVANGTFDVAFRDRLATEVGVT